MIVIYDEKEQNRIESSSDNDRKLRQRANLVVKKLSNGKFQIIKNRYGPVNDIEIDYIDLMTLICRIYEIDMAEPCQRS